MSFDNAMRLCCSICRPEGSDSYPEPDSSMLLASFSHSWGPGGKQGMLPSASLEAFFEQHSHPEHPDYNEQPGMSNFYLWYETTTEQDKEIREKWKERHERDTLNRFLANPKDFVYQSPMQKMYNKLSEDDLNMVLEAYKDCRSRRPK